jgi:hypothetical protein
MCSSYIAVLSTVHSSRISTRNATSPAVATFVRRQLHWQREFVALPLDCCSDGANVQFAPTSTHGQTLLLHLHIHFLSSTWALHVAVAFSWCIVKHVCNSLKRHQLHSHSCIVGRCLRLRLRVWTFQLLLHFNIPISTCAVRIMLC